MALRFFEGFNYDVEEEWNIDSLSTSSAYYDFARSNGRFGTNCLYMARPYYAERPLPDNVVEDSTVVVGMALYVLENDTGANYELFYMHSGGTTVWQVRTDTSGNLGVYVGGVQYGSVPILMDTWEYWEFVVDMDAAAGSVTIFKDGVQEHQTTGIDTKDTTGDIDTIRLDCDYVDLEYYIDDLYILDDSGGGLTSRLGDVHVQTLQPTGHSATHADGVGSDADSTDNHLLVDDGPDLPDETEYVELQALTDRDAYTTGTLGSGEVPKAVKLSAWVGNGDAIDSAVDGFLRISATDYDAADANIVPLGYAWDDWYWDQNPATTADWAEDDLDSIEFGIRSTTP